MEEQDEDLRIRLNRKILGVPYEEVCRFCKLNVRFLSHAEDCTLVKINPKNMYSELADAKIRLRKEANKQRIFKSDKRRWSGLPAGGKTLVKKRRSKNRGPQREMKRCKVCIEQTMFEIRNGEWTCTVCEHVRPCRWSWKRNCQTCWPGE